MPILIIALVLALTSGGGVIYAAHDASPGDMLHGVKSVVERIEQAPQAAQEALVLSFGLSKEGKKAKVESSSDISTTVSLTSTNSITGTGHLTATKPITEGNWYNHTLSAISGITGTTGVTLAGTLSDVVGLAGDDSVPGHSYQGLAAKLRAAAESLQRGKPEAAVHQLDAFLHQLNAMKQSGHIDEANYDKLFADYTQLVAALNGTVQPAGRAPHAGKADAKGADKPDKEDEQDTDAEAPAGEIERHGNSGNSSGGKGKPATVPPGRGRR